MSMKIAEGILPAERPVMVDEDLKFAAAMMVGSRSELGRLRNEALKAVRLLKHRWKPVTARLRKVQQEGIRQVTKARDIGLLTLLSIVMLWPDYTFGEHLVYGFPGVGHCEWSGFFHEGRYPLRRKSTPSREPPSTTGTSCYPCTQGKTTESSLKRVQQTRKRALQHIR